MTSPTPDKRAFVEIREALSFPLSSEAARRDLLVGGTVLWMLPGVGWILNLGHRLDVVYRIFHGEAPYYRGFAPWGPCFKRGLKAFAAICTYLSPAALCAGLAYLTSPALYVLSGVFFCLAIYTLPGGMTYNAAYNDISYLYRPDKALKRAVEGGAAYLWAWCVAILAVTGSALGLLALGVGFFYSSVWAWMVVGYAFSRALSLTEQPGAGK